MKNEYVSNPNELNTQHLISAYNNVIEQNRQLQEDNRTLRCVNRYLTNIISEIAELSGEIFRKKDSMDLKKVEEKGKI